MKRIVIIGSGYAGVNAALEASKKISREDATITLIDRLSYHLAYTYLYEIATSPEGIADLNNLEQTVAIPVEQIISGTGIKFIKDSVTSIDTTNNSLELAIHSSLPYDFLVLALGSKVNYFGIEGAEKFAIGLKSVRDSFLIRNQIESLVEMHRQDMTKPVINIVIAGGGFAGVEIAGELSGLFDHLAKTRHYPRQKLLTTVIEGSSQFMPGLGERVGKAVAKRFEKLGVIPKLNSLINKVDENCVQLKTGEQVEYDSLIWTAGITAAEVPFKTPVAPSKGGRIKVDTTLRLTGSGNVFLAGDLAEVTDPLGKPAPSTARHAIDQGRYIGLALAGLVYNQKLIPYKPKILGYIVPLGGKWAILKTPRFYLAGFWPYAFRQLAMFHYFYQILGLKRALQLSFLENKIYSQND